MPSNQPKQPNRRSSCDQCRQKKLKCSGEYPVCSRCMNLGEDCQYSAKLPMGRPKKRKIEPEAQEPESRTTNESPQSFLERDLRSDSSRESELTDLLSSSLAMPLLSASGAGDSSVWSCEEPRLPPTDPALEALNLGLRKESCACLATLYLALDELRSSDDLGFAPRLDFLRSATAKVTTVIQCSICPSRYVWAMQNTQLVNTLILSIAEAYQRLVQSIEDDAERAAQANEPKALWFAEAQSADSSPASQNNGSDSASFHLSLSPPEWQQLTKKAVSTAIHGGAHTTSISFMSMLKLMEDRQVSWHATTPPINLRCHAPGLAHDGEPLCVMLVRQARAIVLRLPLDS